MSGNIRQELYDRIRESSKDEVILEEMIRLGFWKRSEGQPSAPEDLIQRAGELNREIAALYKQQARWANPEQALKQMHKERKRAAMERRKETKLRRAGARHARAVAWAERRKTDVLYLGEDVSGGLSKGAGACPASGQPAAVADAKALADAMGLALAELRFLAFDRPLSRISHYQRFRIPKKTGGERLISAPMPRLKRAQYWILDNILAHVPIHRAAHGFVPGRSILSNAAPHVGRDVVVNFDLKDFFPTLTWKRVKGKFPGARLFRSRGHGAGADLHRAGCGRDRSGRAASLRQARTAPPAARRANQPCADQPDLLAARPAPVPALAAKLGFTYTRYADDMTLGASAASRRKRRARCSNSWAKSSRPRASPFIRTKRG